MKEKSRKRGGRGEGELVVEEERVREGVVGGSGQRGTEEEEEEEEEEEAKGGRREREETVHGHSKSGACHSHAKSSDGGCVFTPWRCRNQTHPTPFKSPLPTISSCSHVG